jgi:hypothetical protein
MPNVSTKLLKAESETGMLKSGVEDQGTLDGEHICGECAKVKTRGLRLALKRRHTEPSSCFARVLPAAIS